MRTASFKTLLTTSTNASTASFLRSKARGTHGSRKAFVAATLLSAISAYGQINYTTTNEDPLFNIGYGEDVTIDNPMVLSGGDIITLAPVGSAVHSLNIGRTDEGGVAGSGTLTLDGGSIRIDHSEATSGYGGIHVGRGLGSTGTVVHNSGTVEVSGGAFQVGISSGEGHYELKSGSVSFGANATFRLGNGAGGIGTLTISNDATFTRGTAGAPINGHFTVGEGGASGSIIQNGSESIVSIMGGGLRFGVESGSKGSYELSAGSLTMESTIGVVLGDHAGAEGSFIQSGGTSEFMEGPGGNPALRVGRGGAGVFTVSGGTATVHDHILLADEAGSFGTLNLTGDLSESGVLEIKGNISAGAGTAKFNLGGGTLRAHADATNVIVSLAPDLEEGTTSTFDTNGTSITLSNGFTGAGGFEKIGNGALVLGGSSTLAASSSVKQGDLNLGGAGAPTGILTVVGGGTNLAIGNDSSTTGTLNIGVNGALTFDNTTSATNNFDVGANGGTGIVNMSDGAVAFTASGGSGYTRLRVGYGDGSTGTFNQSGGSVDLGAGRIASSIIGFEGGTGAYNLSGDASLKTGNNFHVGRGLRNDSSLDTSGELTLDGDSRFEIVKEESTEAWLYLGRWFSEGRMHQKGNSSVTIATSGLILGTNSGHTATGETKAAAGHYVLEDGTLTVNTSYVRLGESADATGTFTQSGGTSSFANLEGSTVKNAIIVGDAGEGIFTISGGTSTLHSGVLLASAAGSKGTLTLSGGTLKVGGTNGIRKGAGAAHVNLDGGTLSVTNSDLTSSVDMVLVDGKNSTIDTDEANASLTGDLSGTGDLTKTGAGTLTLAGTNSYGATNVTAGTLIIASTGTTGTGAVTIGSDATLSGTGLVLGATTVHGALNPGNSPGNLSFTQGLTLAEGSVTTMEIAGGDLGEYDTLSISNSVLTLGGVLKLDFTQRFEATFSVNLFVLSDATLIGNFSEILLTGAFGSESFIRDGANWTLDLDGSLFAFDAETGQLDVAAIPEPGTWALLISGVAGVWMLRRRRGEGIRCTPSGASELSPPSSL